MKLPFELLMAVLPTIKKQQHLKKSTILRQSVHDSSQINIYVMSETQGHRLAQTNVNKSSNEGFSIQF